MFCIVKKKIMQSNTPHKNKKYANTNLNFVHGKVYINKAKI